ncbi:MAG: murein biosynthesis integral membrane protein MurJ [Chloroflexaceae bacterium]|nr:murein biosynthesis integral membrane protein MurJ [Chloroflexaceae bacterium]
MSGYLLSRATGLLREVVISAQFGTSADLGAYRAAFKVTDMLYMVIIGGALGSSFIPVFIQVWDRDGAARAWQLFNAVVTWALTLLVLASILVGVAAPSLVLLYGPQDLAGRTLNLELTSHLVQLFLLSPLLLGLGGLAMATLNARDHFVLPSLAPALYNLGIIGGALLFAPWWGIWGLAWGVIIGAGFYLLVQLPGLWAMGMRVRPTFGRGLTELRTVAWQMGPRVVGQAAAQVSILVTGALTARLVMGAERLAGLDYAYQLMLLPYGIFSLSLSTVAFPRLARLFSEGRQHELEDRVRRTVRIILFLTLPAMIALIVLAVPLVRLLFQRGAFDQVSLAYTVMPLPGYAAALPAFSLSEILIRTFYARQQTWIPVLVGMLQVGLNLGLGILALHLGGGVGALALAFSVANNLEAWVLARVLARQGSGIWRDRGFWRSVRASVLATLALALVLWAMREGSIATGWWAFLALDGEYAWQTDLLPLIGWLAGVGVVAGGVYAGVAAGCGSDEARWFWQKGCKMFKHV